MTTTALAVPGSMHGHVTAIDRQIDGDEFTAAATTGTTVLSVIDTADFDEAGGSVRINDAIYAYTDIDDDASTITLQAPGLTAGAASGDAIEVWDLDTEGVVLEFIATVVDDTTSDVIQAVVAHDLADRMADNIRGLVGESVVCEEDGDGILVLTRILGKSPAISAEFVELPDGGGSIGENLTDLNAALDYLNGVTLPQLQIDLANNEVALAALDDLFPITATSIASDAITTPKLAANAVLADKIAANQINAGHIVANSIGADQIAANSIGADEIIANSIGADQIAANAITADEIAANAITTAKIAANAITAAKIAAGTITATQIAADTITTDKIAGNGTGGSGNVNFGNASVQAVAFGTSGDTSTGNLYVQKSGGGFIRNTGDTELLGNATIAGRLDAGTIYGGNLTGGATAAIYATAGGGITRVPPSTEKLKQDIEALPLEVAQKIRAVDSALFRWKEFPDGPLNVGVIAEQAESVGADHWVIHDDVGEVAGFDYMAVIPALMLLDRHSAARITDLEQQLADLTTRLAALEGASHG